MGAGDEILAAGHAQRVYDDAAARGDVRRVVICDHLDRPRWHDLWDGNPILVHPDELRRQSIEPHRIRNAKFCRPYVQYPFTTETGWRWTGWRARDHVGRLYLTEHDRKPGRRLRERGRFVLLEPCTKLGSTVNKDWGFERYQAVVHACQDIRFIRVVHEQPRELAGVENVPGLTFRQVLGLLEQADAYLGAEGALHHAAAAFRKPAVVLFGAAVSPEALGYDFPHVNIADTGPGSPCGSYKPCAHCREALARIRPEEVAVTLRNLLTTVRGILA